MIPEALLYFLSVVTLSCSQSAPSKICYEKEGLGCFERIPGVSYEAGFPWDPSKQKTVFILTTSGHSDVVQNLTYRDRTALRDSYFSALCPTFVIIHGFTQNASVPYFVDTQTALLKKFNICANVIRLNWNDPPTTDYFIASANSELIGRQLAVFINMAVTYERARPQDFHLVGHSLGAQIAGLCGKYLKKAFHLTVGRITALDAAGPGFCYLSQYASGTRLNSSDAEFVDAIHTNGGNVSEGLKGCDMRIGHVDFYVNGGVKQPGCKYGDELNLRPSSCDHQISVFYFIESINNIKCGFTSFPAPNSARYEDFLVGKYFGCGKTGCGSLGFRSRQARGRGKQFILTTNRTPFCGSHFKINALARGKRQKEFNMKVTLSDRRSSTSNMEVAFREESQNTAVVISKHTTLDFCKTITATISDSTIPTNRIKFLEVTDDRGNRKSSFPTSHLFNNF